MFRVMLVGSVILNLIPTVFAHLHEYHLYIYGGIILVTIVFLPKGIVGSLLLLSACSCVRQHSLCRRDRSRLFRVTCAARFPILNGGELAVLFCFLFLFFAIAGGGSWSLDRYIRKTPDSLSKRAA